jgi:hypothetical protein
VLFSDFLSYTFPCRHTQLDTASLESGSIKAQSSVGEKGTLLASPAAASAVGAGTFVAKRKKTPLHGTIAPCILMSINYITVLIETESLGKLQQSMQLTHRLYELYQLLTEKERQKLMNGTVPLVKEMPVFPYANLRETLQNVLKEVADYHETALQRALLEAEELRRKQEEEDMLSLAASGTEESPVKKDAKQLRKEKREKYMEQRRVDAIKRSEITKQRKSLYELIQSDRITTIFNARAHSASAANTPGWGVDNEEEVAALNSEMDVLAQALRSGHAEAGSSKTLGNNTSSLPAISTKTADDPV